MPSPLVDALTLALVAATFLAPAAGVLAIQVLVTVLIPPTLAVPHSHTGYATVAHVVLLAGAGRVITLRLEGRLRGDALQLTPVHFAFLVLVAGAFVFGIVAVAYPGPLTSAGFRLADVLDQLLFFVTCLALIRQIADVGIVLRVLAFAILVSAAVAVVEHFTGDAFGHWLFSRLPDQAATDAAQPLQPRAGQLRVRAGTEFSLEFGWIVLMSLPAVVVATLRQRRWQVIAPLAVALTALAAYWSYTRTAVAGLGVVLVLLALLARNRRLTTFVVALVAAGAAAYAVHPALGAHFTAQADEGSITARFIRLAPVLRIVSAHPFRGIGLGELAHTGFATTDNAYLLEYVELGVIGVTALVLLFAVALVQTTRAVLVSVGDDERLVAAACLAGVLGYLASTMVYDAFTLLQGARLLWLLVACATVLAERRAGPLLLPRPQWPTITATTAGAAATGWVVFALAPVHVATEAIFTTLPVVKEAVSTYDPVPVGDTLITTACGVVTAEQQHLAGSHLDCLDTRGAAGLGYLRIQNTSRTRVATDEKEISDILMHKVGLSGWQVFPLGPPRSGRASGWTTAPAWVPLAALGSLTLIPWRRRANADARR